MARNTRVYTDLDMNFIAKDTDGDVYKRVDQNAIKTALKNLVLTVNGERPFHPEIGSPIRNLLFENYSPMMVLTIKRAIEDMISNFEPRATVLDVIVDSNEDENEVQIGIIYAITNTEITDAVTITLDRTR